MPPAAATQYAQGIERFKTGRYVDALTHFRRAEAGWPGDPAKLVGETHETRASLAWNIARCLEKLDRPRDELAALDAALTIVRAPGRVARIRTRIETIEAHAFGRVEVLCAGADAQVWLDEDAPAPCPVSLKRVEPGRRMVQAVHHGWLYPAREIVVRPGAVATAQFAALGRLAIDAPSAITVDGRPIETSEFTLPAGTYTVSVDGFSDRSVTVRPGASHTVEFEPAEARARSPWLGVAVGGGLALAGAITLGFADASADDARTAQSAYAATPDTPASAERLNRLRDTAESKNSDAELLSLTGGIALGVGLSVVLGSLWWSWADEPALAPSIDADRVGAVWRVTF